MRFKKYLEEKIGAFYITSDKNRKCPPGFTFDREQGKCIKETNEDIEKKYVTAEEVKDWITRWKSKLKSYGVTEFDVSNHFLLDRLNHSRNNPPISVKEMDFVLDGFLRKVGSQFKKDVEAVKNHTAKRRGINKKDLKENELEFAVTSISTDIKFVFVLKQDFHKKGTAIVLPVTIIRKKQFRVTKGEQVVVERRILWI